MQDQDLTQDDIAQAITYLDAWASVQHHRQITNDSSLPHRNVVDGTSRAPRTRGHHIPSVQARFLTVEIILKAKKDNLLRKLLLHIYPTSGTYYRGRYFGSFRHGALRHRAGKAQGELAQKFLESLHKEFRAELAVWLSNQQDERHAA